MKIKCATFQRFSAFRRESLVIKLKIGKKGLLVLKQSSLKAAELRRAGLFSLHRKLLATFCLLIAIFSCKSKSTRAYVDRKSPKSAAVAKSGEVIAGSSKIEYVDGKKRLVFRKWKFAGSNGKKVYFIYEEYYFRLKTKPDLSQKKEFPVADTIELPRFNVKVYRLTKNQIIYQVEEK
ncbi:MAG: hypothetical protein D6767_08970 [Candidatus Hydrogenedentota bacterium]|nr:MAG: hypothetical protein D6767_08970 [Candidatus Hydrogenedentota bacterium]